MNTIQNLLDPTTKAVAVKIISFPAFVALKKKDEVQLFRFDSFDKFIKIVIDKYESSIQKWDWENYKCADALNLQKENYYTEITKQEFESALREAIIRLRPEETESLSVVTSPEVVYNTHPC